MDIGQTGREQATGQVMSPAGWGERLSAILTTTRLCSGRSGCVRKWSGQNIEIHQPPLDHHLVVLHLSGVKRLRRIGEGSDSAWIDIPEGAITIIPAGTQYRWRVTGPGDLAHLYVDVARLNHMIETDFDRDHTKVKLIDAVGVTDPLLSELIKAMLVEVLKGSAEHGAYFDRLLDLALGQLALRYSTLQCVTTRARHALAPRRLRQVLEYVETNLSHAIHLDDLARVANLSRYHFSRAFQNAVGESPLAFVSRRRLEVAKQILKQTDHALSIVARRCGFLSQSHFSASFRKYTGRTPTVYREQD
jgi:AraC family transcriptional regulator